MSAADEMIADLRSKRAAELEAKLKQADECIEDLCRPEPEP